MGWFRKRFLYSLMHFTCDVICKSIKALVSLLLGIFVYPWHNLPNSYEEMESIGIDSMLSLMKKKKPLIRKDADSLLTQLKQNSSYLKSPVFLGLISHEFIELVDSFINVGCPSKIQEHFPIFFSTIS